MSEEKKIIKVSQLIVNESSYIASIAYSNELKKTFITFKGGKMFEYPETTVEDFEVLSKAESVGKAFHGSYKHRTEFNELKDTVLKFEEKKDVKKTK